MGNHTQTLTGCYSAASYTTGAHPQGTIQESLAVFIPGHQQNTTGIVAIPLETFDDTIPGPIKI